MRILGISRELKFSPNCENKDSLIFKSVCEELRRRGFIVDEISESEENKLLLSRHPLCFSMARGEKALQILKEKENVGMVVVNSAKCLIKNNRSAITDLFKDNKIPLPKSETLKKGALPDMEYPFWLKRSDACAQNSNDVQYVSSYESMCKAMSDYANRGITDIMASEHVVGDLVKFYGVAGTGFFYLCYPTKDGKTGKFGLEQINGEPHYFHFDEGKLQTVCNRAALLTGFTVYGGDCIVDEYGNFKIIDFNDWPSFSCCRVEASKAIAKTLQKAFLKLCETEKTYNDGTYR